MPSGWSAHGRQHRQWHTQWHALVGNDESRLMQGMGHPLRIAHLGVRYMNVHVWRAGGAASRRRGRIALRGGSAASTVGIRQRS